MSESIQLNSGEEIREWMQQNEPPVGKMQTFTYQQFLEMPDEQIKSKPEPKDGDHWGVVHALFTDDGWPMVDVGRVYVAGSAEEALQQYLFGPGIHQSGHGGECVCFLVRHEFWHEMQEINVFRLAEGTDFFFQTA